VRPRRSFALAALVSLPFAAGCGVGKSNETEHERTTPYVANASIGTMLVRDALVLPAVSTPTASPSPTTPGPHARRSASPSPSPTPAAQAYVTVTFVNSGTTPDTLVDATAGSGIVQPSGVGGGSLTIEPARTLRFGDPDIAPGPALAVMGLAAPPVVGTAVPVTFTFRNAGSVRVLVPVRDPTTIGTTATSTPIPYTGSYPTLATQLPEEASPPPSETPTP
jgi:copper(I)-binding protein